MSIAFASSAIASSLTIENPESGKASIEGESSNFHFLKARIKAGEKTTLKFKQKSCILVGKDKNQYTDCWIKVAGWSGGISVAQSAPISVRTLNLKLSGGAASSSHQWNTSNWKFCFELLNHSNG